MNVKNKKGARDILAKTPYCTLTVRQNFRYESELGSRGSVIPDIWRVTSFGRFCAVPEVSRLTCKVIRCISYEDVNDKEPELLVRGKQLAYAIYGRMEKYVWGYSSAGGGIDYSKHPYLHENGPCGPMACVDTTIPSIVDSWR